MADAHLQEVQKLYNESAQADSAALNADPDVMGASQALESARRALNFDRHNPERQQHLRDAEKTYLAVTNSYHHNVKMAKIAARKAEQKRQADAMQAAADARRKEAQEMTPEMAEMKRRYSSIL